MIGLFAFLFFVFTFLSLGPLIKDHPYYYLDPYILLYKFFPGFSAMRAAGRFAIISYLCLFVFLAIGHKYLFEFIKAKYATWTTRFFSCCLYSLCFIELYSGHLLFFYVEDPIGGQIQEFLNKQSERDLLVLPYPRFVQNEARYSKLQLDYMHLFREQPLGLVNGYSGLNPIFHINLYHELSNFPDSRSLNAIKKIPNVKFVIYSGKDKKKFDSSSFEKSLSDYAKELKLIVKEKDYYLIEVLDTQDVSGSSVKDM